MLVTGASGFIASKLIPVLLADGTEITAAARRSDVLAKRAWVDSTNAMIGDLFDPRHRRDILQGVDTVIHLATSWRSAVDYTPEDAIMATELSHAAASAGVRQIIWCSSLAKPSQTESIQDALLTGPVPAAVLRLGLTCGTGTIADAVLRWLARRPRATRKLLDATYLDQPSQPVDVDDVLYYVRALLHTPGEINRTLDVAGPEVATHRLVIGWHAPRTLSRGAGSILAASRGIEHRIAHDTGLSLGQVRTAKDWLSSPMVKTDGNACDAILGGPVPGLTSVRISAENRTGPSSTSRTWHSAAARTATSGSSLFRHEYVIYVPVTRLEAKSTIATWHETWAQCLARFTDVLTSETDAPSPSTWVENDAPTLDKPLHVGHTIGCWKVAQCDGDGVRFVADVKTPGVFTLHASVVPAAGETDGSTFEPNCHLKIRAEFTLGKPGGRTHWIANSLTYRHLIGEHGQALATACVNRFDDIIAHAEPENDAPDVVELRTHLREDTTLDVRDSSSTATRIDLDSDHSTMKDQ